MRLIFLPLRSNFGQPYKMADNQTERAYQKQPTVFLNSKNRLLGVGKKSNKSLRYVRNVGLGFKTPLEVLFKILFLIILG